MKKFLFCICVLMSAQAFAGFGGSRSGGGGRSSFGGSRSYSAPSRSYSAPSRSSQGSSFFGGQRSGYQSRPGSAPITRPAPAAPLSSGTVHNTTVIHSGGSGFGGGFWNGMLFGSLMNRPAIMVGGGGMGGYPVVPGPVIGPSFMDILFALVIWALIVWLVFWILIVVFRSWRVSRQRKKGLRHDW